MIGGFVVGMVFGACIGITMMCVMFVGGESDEYTID